MECVHCKAAAPTMSEMGQSRRGRLSAPSIHFRNAPESRRTVRALASVAMGQKPTSLIDYFIYKLLQVGRYLDANRIGRLHNSDYWRGARGGRPSKAGTPSAMR